MRNKETILFLLLVFTFSCEKIDSLSDKQPDSLLKFIETVEDCDLIMEGVGYEGGEFVVFMDDNYQYNTVRRNT